MVLKRSGLFAAILLLLMLSSVFMPTLRLSAAGEDEALIQAIEAANRRGSGRISLTADIVLRSTLPSISGDVEVEGNGHAIDGAGANRIFVVDGGKLTVRDLTLANGSSDEDGGAILIQGNGELIVEDSTFTHNESMKGGGAISTSDSNVRLEVRRSIFDGNSSESGGGAILVIGGAAQIADSSFLDNVAKRFGGGLEAFVGEVSVSNSTFSRNRAAEGGAIHVSGAATLTHLTIVENVASESGDGIFKRSGRLNLYNSIVAGGGGASDCKGGLDEGRGNFSQDGTCGQHVGADPMLAEPTGSPVYYPLLDGSPAVDTADMAYCLETDQTGKRRPIGGGCDIGAFESATAMPAEPTPVPEICPLDDQIIAANSDTAVGNCAAGNGADLITLLRDFTLEEPLPRITTEITIDGNGYTINGSKAFRMFDIDGGRLTLKNLKLVDGMSAEDGGAILVQNGARLVVENTTFLGNESRKGGGAIATGSQNVNLTIRNSVFASNHADSGGGAILVYGGRAEISGSAFVDNEAGRFGGGVEAFVGTVRISNSTFARNRAGRAGAILVSGATTTLTHLTLVDNLSYSGEGDAIHKRSGLVYLRNSIIAGDGNGLECTGGLDQSAGNFSEDGSCALLPGGNPLLGDLTGSPGYFPLLDGSPLVDAADSAFCLATDQAGKPRPIGGGCDIGAAEFGEASVKQLASVATAEDSSACRVTTTHALNFRDGPAGNRIGLVPANATLTASARDSGWFNVDYGGVSGWISADYVTTAGVCG